MLFQSHSTAIFPGLDIFKNVKNFFERTIYLLKKHPNFERLENLTNSVAFSGKFATFGDF